MTRRRRRPPSPPGGSGPDLLDARPRAVLDLHGFRGDEVALAVANFVTSWQRRSPGAVVHIVTGRGRGSAGRPVLAPAVRRCLRGDLAGCVREWCPDVAGGGFLVRLR
jgi:DNA-nicking Smr family endonuclease